MTRSALPAVLVLALALASCGPRDNPSPAQGGTDTNTATASAPSAANTAMPGMADAASAQPVMARSTGRVTAIDAAGGTVTIDHAPIPEANWPSMTMAFRAPPAALSAISVGDQVAFDLTVRGGSGEVTAIRRTP